jgi:hypothetical protein
MNESTKPVGLPAVSTIATLLASFALAVLPQAAVAVDIFDQETEVPAFSSSHGFTAFSLAQSFTPTFTTIAFVDALLSCSGPASCQLRFDIRDGGILGPVIGSTSTVVIPNPSSGSFHRFLISPPIALTPGGTYVLELVNLGGGDGSWQEPNLDYTGGTGFIDGTPYSSFDYIFRTGIFSDEVPQTGDTPVSVEYSNDVDEGALPGGGQGAADPGQVLLTEPPDDLANSLPVETTDFVPGIESGAEPDAQVDALAQGFDFLYTEVQTGEADLVVSFDGDLVMVAGAFAEVAAMLEANSGSTSVLYTQLDLDASDSVGVVEDVDGIELWGPVGSGDAFYYSLENDALTGTSVWLDDNGTLRTFITHGRIVSAVNALGFTGADVEVDVDALMVRNVGAKEDPDVGDEILFSIHAAGNFDGGEIIQLPVVGTPSFLEHGGHTWDTAFSVIDAFGSDSEDIDAIEAFPSAIPLPTLKRWPIGVLAMLLTALTVAYYAKTQPTA